MTTEYYSGKATEQRCEIHLSYFSQTQQHWVRVLLRGQVSVPETEMGGQSSDLRVVSTHLENLILILFLASGKQLIVLTRFLPKLQNSNRPQLWKGDIRADYWQRDILTAEPKPRQIRVFKIKFLLL